MDVITQELQSTFVDPVATVTVEVGDINAKFAADTVAVTVVAALAKLVTEIEAGVAEIPGGLFTATVLLGVTVAAVTILEIVLGPVVNNVSVMAAFVVSKTLATTESWALHPDPLGQ